MSTAIVKTTKLPQILSSDFGMLNSIPIPPVLCLLKPAHLANEPTQNDSRKHHPLDLGQRRVLLLHHRPSIPMLRVLVREAKSSRN
jgi:hypothetical protein